MKLSMVGNLVLFALTIVPGPLLAQNGSVWVPTSIVAEPEHQNRVKISAEFQGADPFEWEKSPGTRKVRRGEKIDLFLEVTPAEGWHGYPFTQRGPNQDAAYLSVIKLEPATALMLAGPPLESDAHWVNDPVDNSYLLEHPGPFWVRIPVAIPTNAKVGTYPIGVSVRLQVCSESRCIPGTHIFSWNLEVEEQPTGLPTKDFSPFLLNVQVKTPPGGNEITPPNTAGKSPISPPKGKETGLIPVARIPLLPEVGTFVEMGRYDESKINNLDAFAKFLYAPSIVENAPEGFIAFLLLGMAWGAISLVTPCVFPMIPVTVSFFLKQDNSKHGPFYLATVYCATIIVVLSLAAFAFLSVFAWLSTNTIFNIVMGFLFIYFSLSLLGMYDIELPTFLTNFTSSRERKGGISGTVFMALTFTMLSFACVAPFLGGFGGVGTQGAMPWWQRLLGGVAFSATFASPFFLLALFPGYLKSLPKSGGWLNTVKVTMGFLELAAAIKFFRLAEIKYWDAQFFTYDLSMALTVAILLVCSVYLFGLFRLPLDTPEDSLGVPRAVFATVVLAIALHLIPSLWSQPGAGGNLVRNRPQGVIFSWLDAFLLPDEQASGESEGPSFGGDLALALEQSKKDGKLVFVDFTGVTCSNCKWNEANIFPRPEIRKLLEKYHLVQLYTDRVPTRFFPAQSLANNPGLDLKTGDANLEFHRVAFGTIQLPQYLFLKPK